MQMRFFCTSRKIDPKIARKKHSLQVTMILCRWLLYLSHASHLTRETRLTFRGTRVKDVYDYDDEFKKIPKTTEDHNV